MERDLFSFRDEKWIYEMSECTNAQKQNKVKQTFRPLSNAVLQRKCGCGQHTIGGGECASCGQKRKNVLQRSAINKDDNQNVPPIVYDVLGSPGQPLDKATRDFMEPRLGHDLSRVRVHTDSRAKESAQAVNALAYTVGHNVVFGAGQYAPGTSTGQQVLAHELVHVAQQSNSNPRGRDLVLGDYDTVHEHEAEAVSASLGGTHAGHAGTADRPGLTDTGSGVVQRAGPAAVAAGAGVAVGAFALGFGAAFGIDYLSMTHDRAERYALNLDTLYPGWLSALPNCPCAEPTTDTANWVHDSNPDLQTYHPGAASSYRSTSAATGGSRHGQQCTYDAAARLITSGAAAGTPDVYSPSWGALNIPYHIVYDVKTFKELGWATYDRYWRPNNGNSCAANNV